MRLVASLVIDLAQRFHVIRNKGNRHDADLAGVLGRKNLQSLMKRWLQPATGAHLALVTEAMRVAPTTPMHQQAHGFFDLPLVRIAFLDYRHGNTVRAENNLCALGAGKTRQSFIDLLGHRIKIRRFAIEGIRHVYRQIIPEQPVPFIEA